MRNFHHFYAGFGEAQRRRVRSHRRRQESDIENYARDEEPLHDESALQCAASDTKSRIVPGHFNPTDEDPDHIGVKCEHSYAFDPEARDEVKETRKIMTRQVEDAIPERYAKTTKFSKGAASAKFASVASRHLLLAEVPKMPPKKFARVSPFHLRRNLRPACQNTPKIWREFPPSKQGEVQAVKVPIFPLCRTPPQGIHGTLNNDVLHAMWSIYKNALRDAFDHDRVAPRGARTTRAKRSPRSKSKRLCFDFRAMGCGCPCSWTRLRPG